MDKEQPEAQERKFWKRLCALNRFSFFYMGGGVARASDKSGNWIEVHSAQEIVDDAECEVSTQQARITELESQLAQRFDAADMATASAQGFRDGVASVGAGSEPVANNQPAPDGDDSLLLCASDLQHSAIYDNHVEMQACMRAVADRITALATNPADSVQEDAARYRWLREGNDAKHGAAWHVAVNLYGCEWDAAIDAAMNKGARP